MLGDFKVLKKCQTTNARLSSFTLNSTTLALPIFMPVATYGAMRGVKASSMPESMILSNTYHLRNLGRNIKEFMGWQKGMLTDSGGFQIQSIPDVSVTDEGVVFEGRLFTPEDSMEIQLTLGADVMMQLDDVVNPMVERERHEKAVERSIEWLDRALSHISRGAGEEKRRRVTQLLFPIIQGGLHADLRDRSIKEILKREPRGIAIGGLSGGEDKTLFCRTVLHCCRALPEGLPRYLMGVGYPEDIVVCCALGTDMSDCVYPTRTGRFGRVFTDDGDVLLDGRVGGELGPISESCGCSVCRRYSRAYLVMQKGTANFCMLATVHNMHYMRELTRRIREAIEGGRYPEFIREFMRRRFKEVPGWIVEALKWVNVDL